MGNQDKRKGVEARGQRQDDDEPGNRYRDTVRAGGDRRGGKETQRPELREKDEESQGKSGSRAGWGALVEALGILAGGGARAGAGGRASARDMASAGRRAPARFRLGASALRATEALVASAGLHVPRGAQVAARAEGSRGLAAPSGALAGIGAGHIAHSGGGVTEGDTGNIGAGGAASARCQDAASLVAQDGSRDVSGAPGSRLGCA